MIEMIMTYKYPLHNNYCKFVIHECIDLDEKLNLTEV